MKIGIIGGGNMGLAIASRVADKHPILICEKDSKRAAILQRKFKIVTLELKDVLRGADVIIIAVKPQDIDAVLAETREWLCKEHVVISIAAGITTQFLEKCLGGKVRVVRTMPNMPAQIGQGITAIAKGKFATDKDIQLAVKIFDFVGETVVVKENLLDAITAVSGSGPAYVFLFTECLLAAAQKLGLDAVLSEKLVRATLRGSVQQMLESDEAPADLRAKVTSKGGTTQAALEIFEQKHIRDIFVQGLAAAKRRAKELAKK